MATTNFPTRELLPSLRTCGLLPREIAADRKVQEVVYLLGRAGAELGYRYKWEMFGPYSVELADDVRDLDRELIETASTEGAPVPTEVLERVRALLQPPEHLDLAQDDWLRLVTCVDFVERRAPGATENGGTPVFLARNFDANAIGCARDRLRQQLA
jgi:hypothetical protein